MNNSGQGAASAVLGIKADILQFWKDQPDRAGHLLSVIGGKKELTVYYTGHGEAISVA